MGTRGFITFVADGEEKTAYNHFDSYPDGLGTTVLKWLHAATDSVSALREQVLALRVVDGESKPTPEDIERLRKFADTGVSTQQLDDWYVLLRRTQGDPHAILEAGVMEDAKTFPLDSLWAEWGYVIDLDKVVFEAYSGYTDSFPTGKGRFADREGAKGRPPVTLVASWPLAELPTEEAFLAALDLGDE
jgi:hypothetical protein